MLRRKLIACILVIAMVLGMLTVVGASSTSIESAPSTVRTIYTEYSATTLKKNATYDNNWINNKESTITLSVSSSATTIRPPVLVEFVLDATESFWLDIKFREAGLNPVEELQKALKGKDIYSGVTIFTSKAQSIGDLTASKLSAVDPDLSYEQIVDTANRIGEAAFMENRSGTNMQAGIHVGLQNLKARRDAMIRSGVTPIACYLVLISDGGSFYYYADDTYDDAHLIGDVNDATEVERLADLLESPAKADTNFEKAVVASAKALDELEPGIELLTVGIPYYKDSGIPTLTALAADVMQVASDRSVYSMVLEEETFDARQAAALIAKIANDLEQSLLYSLPARSTITDIIGSGTDNLGDAFDFNLLTDRPITMTVGKIVMTGILNNNRISFKNNGDEYGVLEYHPGDPESLVLTFKRPVSLDEAVSLSYSIVLDSPSVHKGTHIVDTNNIAYLIPLSYSVNPPELPVSTTLPKGVGAMEFHKPTLGYIADAGAIIPYNPSNDDINRPVDKIPELNMEDHFGYIIGYPVDYKTGAYTNVQSRMPVRPENLITRAEVATIYFRMLTDASREKLWTKQNPFSDVPEDAWYDAAVSTLANGGILIGDPSGKFRPNDPITRAEFATIAIRFFGGNYAGEDLFSDIAGHWAQNNINLAATDGLINGYPDGTFLPNQNILRCEAIAIVNRSLNRHPDKAHLLSDMLVWPDNMDTSKWYYAEMQEATNSHNYDMIDSEEGTYEIWTKMRPIRDWVQFERIWSDAHSAPNPGEVVKSVG